jgi:exodeoxyribonuclease VII large subunit
MTIKKTYSLSKILNGIKLHLEQRVKGKYFWLKVEISNISFHRSGHCYIDLVETKNSQILAQCKATIWNYNIDGIKSELGSDFNNILKKGSEILCYSELTYNEIYGLQIKIISIDKSFIIGELEKKKQNTLEQLKNEGLIGKNKEVYLPTVIQKIALIGSPNTSGHIDFLKQLEKNGYGFKFEVIEYHCQVQGDKAEIEILSALNKLKNETLDAIMIIRGGGSKLDLEVFNSYILAKEIANFHLPVFTGIGHETDISVIDLVANKHFKTPSAVGSYLVERAYQYYVKVTSSYNYIMEYYNRKILAVKNKLNSNTQYLHSKSHSITRLSRGGLHTISNRIISQVNHRLNQEKLFLNLGVEVINAKPKNYISNQKRSLSEFKELILLYSRQLTSNAIKNNEQNLNLIFLYVRSILKKENNFIRSIEDIPEIFNPKNVLKKGYSIIRINHIVINNKTILKLGDEIEIELYNRKLKAVITKDTNKWQSLITKMLQKN